LTSASPLPDLSNIDVRLLLRQLGDLKERIVVVGGQAVAIWAETFAHELPPDLRASSLTSKDIDFTGDRAAVQLAADRLHGEALFPDRGDSVTPNVGVVKYVDLSGDLRGIDFLEVPFGLPNAEVVNRRAQRVELLDEQGLPTGDEFLVLNPIHTLHSRVANVAALPGGDSPAGIKQLRASVATARGFIRTVLTHAGARPALDLIEEVFALASSRNGLKVFTEHGVDVLAAAPLSEPALPELFRARRCPQLVESLSRRRSPKG
jgi:hypothetical protein